MGAHTGMCAGGSTSGSYNIITIITIYIRHGGCRNVDASGGLCVFSASYIVASTQSAPSVFVASLSAALSAAALPLGSW